MKEDFISLLRSTGREGMEQVVSYLEKAGFFTAPASTSRHLNRDGGLVEHSLNVCHVALALREQMIAMQERLAEQLPRESVIIASLLHDVCKANIYKKAKRWRKDEQNRWEQYDSYETDYSRLPVGHGEKSVIMLLRLGLVLTNDEIVAIRWHMAAWNLSFQSYEEVSNLGVAADGFPLVSLLQAADNLSTHLLEQ